MRVFVAGATGVIGRRLVPALLAAGHEVSAMSRSEAGAEVLRGRSVDAFVGDVFDEEALRAELVERRPEVVIHQLTALPKRINPRFARRDLGPTCRLRAEGTPVLVAAARAAGARRLVYQSISFMHPPGAGLRGEEDPLYFDGPGYTKVIVGATAAGERAALETEGIEGVVLRYGMFYGPGTVYAEGGSMYEDVRRRRIPVVGAGDGVASFIHLDDAVSATMRVLGDAPEGIYHVVDDDPAPARAWLPAYAEAIGAPPPRRVPSWLAWLGAGAYGVYLTTAVPGASNAKAKEVLGWAPKRSSWRVEPVLDAV